MSFFTLDENNEIKKRFANPFNSASDYCEALEFFQGIRSFESLVKTLHYMLRSFMKAEEVNQYSSIEDLRIDGFDLHIPGDKREDAYISVTFSTASSASSTKVTGNVYHSINEHGYKFTLKDSLITDGTWDRILDLQMKETFLGGGCNDYEYTTCQ